jgi:hypothetical protein
MPENQSQTSGRPVCPADEILNIAREALRLRAVIRDQPKGERSIGRAVNIYKAVKMSDSPVIDTEADGWLFQICLKLARSQQGAFHLDDYVDGSGYFALYGEAAAAAENEPKPECICGSNEACSKSCNREVAPHLSSSVNRFYERVSQLPDGWYWLHSVLGTDTCLVKLYTPLGASRGIGFGAWDGGAFMPVCEVDPDAWLEPAAFVAGPASAVID